VINLASKKGKKKRNNRGKSPRKKKKKGGKAKKIGFDKASTAFFIMPAEVLLTLRAELSPLASDLAVRAILFRYGFRSGEACIQRLGIKAKEEKFPDILPDLWDEIGLGRLEMKKSKEESFTIQLNESIEGNVMGKIGQASCDFTRGYLAGIISQLTGQRYHCREEECISRGDAHCMFLLNIREKRGET
jgi:predicted hydrocarbon binding protein